MEEINEVNEANEIKQDETVVLTQNEVPKEIKKWNWGAFIFNIFWGIGHNSYLPLLCLVPLLNIVWIFVCGAKGNEWAWKKGSYASAEEFLRIQKSWNRAGLASFIISAGFLVLYILLIVVGVAASVSLY